MVGIRQAKIENQKVSGLTSLTFTNPEADFQKTRKLLSEPRRVVKEFDNSVGVPESQQTQA
jgi:hypothetical protein